MNTFISLNKIIKTGLSANEKKWLESISVPPDNPLTLVFADKFAGDKDRELLKAILKAVKCPEENCIIIDKDKHPNVRYRNLILKHRTDILRVLSFGSGPEHIGLNTDDKMYEVYHHKGMSVLYADSLNKLGSNTELKRRLWESMQLLFT